MDNSADLATMSSSPAPAPAPPPPTPVRNLIPQIPSSLLSTLLTYHASAYEPQSISITSLANSHISLSYLQPVRELAFKPLNRKATIPFIPPLSVIPAEQAGSEKHYEWESECAGRLKEMEKEAQNRIEGRSDILVTRYLPPNTFGSYFAMLQFILLTATIACWIIYGQDAPYGIGPFLATRVFDKEWKVNATVVFHAALLVKKWAEVLEMAKKLRRHQVDRLGRAKGPWLLWLVTAFFEGWRCSMRFDDEVRKIGRELAAEQAEQAAGEKKKDK